MSTRALSVLIPSKNEQWLKNTVEDVLANIEADTEIIIIADGLLPLEPIDAHDRVRLVYRFPGIGQRAATNEAAKLSDAKYVMKLDAHCRVSKGFDRAMIEDCQPDWTMVPAQYRLHVFDWKCQVCENRTYQGRTPTACAKCQAPGATFERVLVWEPRFNKGTSETWRFDKTLHFQYWHQLMKRPEIKAQGQLHDTMSLLGACWFLERERYWKLGGLDEQHGSWGNMGTEIACKTWLSGGRLVTTQKAWFAHLFRTAGGDFGFPYEMKSEDQEKARSYSRSVWLNNKWPGQKYPLEWLIDKFAPVPDWHTDKAVAAPAIVESRPTKSILYYTDCQLSDPIAEGVQKQISRAANSIQIVSVSLGKAIDFGDENVIVQGERGVLTLYRQILTGLEKCADIVYMCEHDVLYHQSHFAFEPPHKDGYFYNQNLWRVDSATGHALFYLTFSQSQLVADRETLIIHYEKRIARIEREGHYSRSLGHEPGLHRLPRGIDNVPAIGFCSAFPNIDIRHENNITKSRWRKSQFRDKRTCLGWTEAQEIPYWGKTGGRFNEFLSDIDSQTEA
jgi:hypothetical protein